MITVNAEVNGHFCVIAPHPIPGTKRVTRVEENTAADGIELTAEQVEKLSNLTPAAGDHHNEAQMRMLDR
jgi:diketogulonate reductase-like aldo/keto reductase